MNKVDKNAVIQIAINAGKSILHIYNTEFTVEQKEDKSPLTTADKASHNIIMEGLTKLNPEIPILSEEGKSIDYHIRKNWEIFWLVDPLDGTKEFIKKNGEFTVNIALIEKGYPVMGIVYAPSMDNLYVGFENRAYMIDQQGKQTELKVNRNNGDKFTIVESRSHPSRELEELINKIENKYTNVERIQRGSSLKLCAVAEGTADLYPRLGPTMEWDTAAGQAVVEAAGGKVTTLDGKRFKYNKESLLNEYFLVLSHTDILV